MFLTMKNNSVENVLEKCCFNFCQKTVSSLKGDFLILFGYICELLLLFLVLEHNFNPSDLRILKLCIS